MCHDSKFLDIQPLEQIYFYVVVRRVSKSGWVILWVVFEARLKKPQFYLKHQTLLASEKHERSLLQNCSWQRFSLKSGYFSGWLKTTQRITQADFDNCFATTESVNKRTWMPIPACPHTNIQKSIVYFCDAVGKIGLFQPGLKNYNVNSVGIMLFLCFRFLDWSKQIDLMPVAWS